tara:strand:+ start:57 stop:230 length:174 start_codon:yes stop_codon:yes gene_type:complete
MELWVVDIFHDGWEHPTRRYFQRKQAAQAYVGAIRTEATVITIRQATLKETEQQPED